MSFTSSLTTAELNELYVLANSYGAGAPNDKAWVRDVIAGFGTNGGHKFVNHMAKLLHNSSNTDAVIQDIANHSTSAEQTALLKQIVTAGGLPSTYTLTTGVDNINSTVDGDVVNGNAGGAGQTFSNGDVINGIAGTTVNITTTGSAFSPGVVTMAGVGAVNIIADASNTYNAAQWSGIGAVAVAAGSAQNSVTGISNAASGTIYELSAGAGNNASLDVGFANSGAESFGLMGSGSSTNWATLDATGMAAANGLADAVTAATIATSGTNYDYVNLGTNDHSVTLTGNGADTLSFGALASSGGLSINWSSIFSGDQNLTFQSGALDTNGGNTVTITGGGSGNSVTADGMTGTESLTMSGVQSLTTTFVGDTTFDGTHVSGLDTITVNSSTGADTFNNMSSSLSALNINGAADGLVTVNYAAPAPDLTVTFGGNSGPVAFDGLTTTNAEKVTVVFNDAGGFSGATGAINVDEATTSLTVENTAAGSEVSVLIDPLTIISPLTSFTETAAANYSSIAVDNFVLSDGANFSVTLSALGTSSSAWLDGVVGFDGIGTVNVNASGAESFAGIGSVSADTVLPETIGSVNVTASGASSDGSICTVTFLEDSGVLGAVNITASGDYSEASIGSICLDGGVVQGEITVTASGAAATANLGSISDTLDIGSVDVLASGVASTAYVCSVQADYIETITVTASAEPSTAYISNICADSIVSIATLASGNDSQAYIGNISVEDSLGSLSITASGVGSQSTVDSLCAYDVGSISVTASGSHAEADLDCATIYSLGSVSVTASGTDSSAEANISAASVGSASVSATGSGSMAELNLDDCAQITITAKAAAHATADIALDSYVSSDVAGGAGTINASGAGALTVCISDEVPGVVNAANTGGFNYYVTDPSYGWTPTTITSASTHNYIQAGNGVETINAANGENTFDFSEVTPFGPSGASGSALGSISSAAEIINSGFQTLGANDGGTVGQLLLDANHAGTAANFLFAPIVLPTFTASGFAIAAAAFLTGTGGVEFTAAADGHGDTWVAVDNTSTAHTVTDLIEIVGTNTVSYHDIIA